MKYKSTPGTVMAAKLRSQCNSMTREERNDAYLHAVSIIYAKGNTVTITQERMNLLKTKRGGFKKAALEIIGVPWPPKKGWMDRNLPREISESDFILLRSIQGLE